MATTRRKPAAKAKRRPNNSAHLKKARQDRFLAEFARMGNVSAAAAAAGVGRRDHYDWIAEEGYRLAFEDAKAEAVELMEREAWRRGVEGWDEPVYYQGDEVGVVRKYSTTLLIFLLKAANPEKYRENRRVELTGADGEPLALRVRGPK